MTRMEAMHGLPNMGLPSARLVWLLALLTAETNAEPSCGIIPQGDQPATV